MVLIQSRIVSPRAVVAVVPGGSSVRKVSFQSAPTTQGWLCSCGWLASQCWSRFCVCEIVAWCGRCKESTCMVVLAVVWRAAPMLAGAAVGWSMCVTVLAW